MTVGATKPAIITFSGAITLGAGAFLNAAGNTADLSLVANGAVTLGAGSSINADLKTLGAGAVTIAADSWISGNVSTETGAVVIGAATLPPPAPPTPQKTGVGGNISTMTGQVSMGAGSVTNGSITTQSAGYVVLGANAKSGSIFILGAGYVALGAGVQVSGSIATHGVTTADYVSAAAGSTVSGNISTAGSYVVLRANTKVGGDISTKISYIEVGTDVTVGGLISMNDPTPSRITIGMRSKVYAVCCNGKDASCVTDDSGITPGPLVCTAPSGGSLSASFECLATGTNAAWSAGARKPLYTKLADTSFMVDIAVLKTDGTLETNYVGSGGTAKNVTLEWVDGAGATACASRTVISPAQSQTLTFSAADAGRKSTAGTTFAQAHANLRCRVTDATQSPSVVACSSDNFSIRPKNFFVSSSNANADSTGASPSASPAIKAGASISLSADTATAGYNGTPVLVASKVAAHTGAIQVGTLTGTFGPATVSTGNGARGSGFSYGEVGYFKLNAGGVLDASFTAVDSAGSDCVSGSFSNTVDSTGKFGCSIGSTASAYFGRFIPDHFLVSAGSVVNRLAAACNPASAFSYAGEAWQLKDFKLTAANGLATPTTTQNYHGTFARFDGNVISNFSFAAVDLADGIAPLATSTFSNGSSTGTFGLVSSTGTWSSGLGTFSATVNLNRSATPAGPYESFRVGIEPIDPDGVGVLSGAKNLDISAPADAVNDKVLIGSTAVRYGRIRMQNVYGSDLLALPLPLELQYWAGSYYVTHTADSCTLIPVSSITMGNYARQLSACKTQLTPVGSVSVVAGKLPEPGLVLTRPGANNSGSVDLAVNISAIATGNTCLGSTESAASAANMPWFGTNPGARATFGIYRSSIIYRRENY